MIIFQFCQIGRIIFLDSLIQFLEFCAFEEICLANICTFGLSRIGEVCTGDCELLHFLELFQVFQAVGVLGLHIIRTDTSLALIPRLKNLPLNQRIIITTQSIKPTLLLTNSQLHNRTFMRRQNSEIPLLKRIRIIKKIHVPLFHRQ